MNRDDELLRNELKARCLAAVRGAIDNFGWGMVLTALRDLTEASVASLSPHSRTSRWARMNTACHLNNAREEMEKAVIDEPHP